MRSAPSTSTYLALTGTTFAFGLSFVATKYGLRGFEPLLLALLRFTLAGGILWLVWRVFGAREQATRAELGRLAALGFVSLTVYFSFENSGIARTSASQAAILMAAVPIFVVVLNLFTLREHNSGRQWAGVALSFVGIVGLVLLGGGSGGGSMTGNLLVLVASVAAAAYTLLARHMLVKRSALFVTTFQNLFGALFMLPLALVEALLFGVRRPAWTSARRPRLPGPHLLGARLPAAQLRPGLRRGEQGERLPQPHPRGRRRRRVPGARGAFHARAGGGRRCCRVRRVADEQWPADAGRSGHGLTNVCALRAPAARCWVARRAPRAPRLDSRARPGGY